MRPGRLRILPEVGCQDKNETGIQCQLPVFEQRAGESVRNENRYKKDNRVDEEKTTVPGDPIERRSENGIQIGILGNQAAVVGPQVAGRL